MNNKIIFDSLLIRKIRNVFVVGYWTASPHNYWSDKVWTPLLDFKNGKLARGFIRKSRIAENE